MLLEFIFKEINLRRFSRYLISSEKVASFEKENITFGDIDLGENNFAYLIV